MIKNFIIFILATSFINPLTALFDLYPWIILENKTPFHVTCTLKFSYPQENVAQPIIPELSNNNNNIVIHHTITTNAVLFTVTTPLTPLQTKIINPIFIDDHININIPVTSVSFTQESLQLTATNKPENFIARQFILDFNKNEGINPSSQQISLYCKSMNNIQLYLDAFITALLKLLDYYSFSV